jgi:hypothetical protein
MDSTIDRPLDGTVPVPTVSTRRRIRRGGRAGLGLLALLVAVVSPAGGPSAEAQTATTYPTPVNVSLDAETAYFVVLSSEDGYLELEVGDTIPSFGYVEADDCEYRLVPTDDDCFTTDPEGGDPAIGFQGTGSSVQAALATLTFTPLETVSLSAARLSVEINVNPGGLDRKMYYNPTNGHYYEWVGEDEEEEFEPLSLVTWFEARTLAEALTLQIGTTTYTGYLATITTESEQRFAFQFVSASNVWIGASDDYRVLNSIITDIRAKNDFADGTYAYTGQFKSPLAGGERISEGRWYWVSGPEKGTLIGTEDCVDGFQKAVGQESFWDTVEPNNFGPGCGAGDYQAADGDPLSGEHYAVLNVTREDPLLNWNDYPEDIVNNGFLAEFGPIDPALAAALVTLDREFSITELIPTSAPAVVPPTLVCTPDPVAPGGTVTCRVSGGDPDIDVLWRAAFEGNVFASLGVRLGPDGVGSFTFVAPRGAACGTITVELVEWLPPITISVACSALPSGLPAGEGGVPGSLLLLGVLTLAGAGVLVRRMGVAAG